MKTDDAAKRLVDKVLAKAKAVDKTAEAIARYSEDTTGNTRLAADRAISSGDVERVGLSVTVQLGKRVATASTNQLDDHSLDDVVSRAHRLAKLSPEDPEAQPVLAAQKYVAAKNAVDGDTAGASAATRAKACANVLVVAHDRGVTLAGYYQHGVHATSIGTSGGLWAYHRSSSSVFSCTARTSDGTGSGWAGQQSNKIADLDTKALATIAADKAKASAKPQKLAPGKYTVVLEPAITASLMNFFVGALDARRADEGRSYFAKIKLGDEAFAKSITLRTDPTDATFAASPFDGDGLPVGKQTFVDQGKLAALAYSRYWAAKQGKPPTGRPTAWILDGGTATRDELIKGVDRGLLVTRAWYLRMVDPQTLVITGLTRDGVFLIEKGAVTSPVTNFRFNESPAHVLETCDALGAMHVPGGTEGGGMRMPWLRCHDFNMASISEAV